MPEWRPWTHGQRNTTLTKSRQKEYERRHPPVRLDNPSVEELRQCIRDGRCWWCGMSGWKVLSLHTYFMHGISAHDIREMAFLFKHTPTCVAETSHQRTLHWNRENLAKAQAVPRTKLHVLSPAGKVSARERILRVSNDDQRRKAGKASAEKNSKPHPCPACGIMMPRSFPITCSLQCRKIIRQRTALISAATRKRLCQMDPEYRKHLSQTLGAAMKGRVAHNVKPHPCPICGRLIPYARPKTCSPECRRVAHQRSQFKAMQKRHIKIPHSEYGIILRRYKEGESTRVIATTYSVTPRFIRFIIKKPKDGEAGGSI